ncbi:hypothetical protein MMC21_002298 [Puttea exsequens]|nr:hypothetical protein [Puttea exsequens]
MDSEETDSKENVWFDVGTEDELMAPAKLSRVTPRNSIAGKASPKPTPHANLRQLAAIIRKPSTPRYHSSGIDEPLSERHVAINSAMLSRTPNTRQLQQLLRRERSNPTTPHAIRAMQQRRATPGWDRRKSGRMQRETPRDVLRNLSRVLVPVSRMTDPVSVSTQTRLNNYKETADENFHDELDLPQPTFSIAIDDDIFEEDSLPDAPPRFSMPLDDIENTRASIEVGRRATSDRMHDRVSRGSFGSTRASDRFTNISDLNPHDEADQEMLESIESGAIDAEIDELAYDGGDTGGTDLGGDTRDLRRLVFGRLNEGEERKGELQRDQQLQADALSPFVLKIPNVQPRRSSVVEPTSASLPEYQVDDLDDLQIAENATRLPCHIRPVQVTNSQTKRPKPLKKSLYGIPYPNLPPGIAKRVATVYLRSMGLRRLRLGRETLQAIVEASDQYFAQLSQDLAAFSHHAGRKNIDENDAIAVMKRQRILSTTSTIFSLAHTHLSGELVEEMRIPVPRPRQQRRKIRLERISEDIEELDNDLRWS